MATSRSLKLLLLLLVPCFALAQTKYADPDSPAVQAAARAALPHAKIVDIVGMTSGIQGVLQDLKAKVTEHEVKIELDADVLFDFDKYNLRPQAADSLLKVGEVAKNYGNSAVLIEGHTDSKGSPPYNMKLSENRALSVKNWLVQNARVSAARINTRGWGETKPVAPNTNPNGSDNPAGRQKNRRVEITIRTG
jgi:outer membrane protein OmpA-like peptidoglycan-associated protein